MNEKQIQDILNRAGEVGTQLTSEGIAYFIVNYVMGFILAGAGVYVGYRLLLWVAKRNGGKKVAELNMDKVDDIGEIFAIILGAAGIGIGSVAFMVCLTSTIQFIVAPHFALLRQLVSH